MTVTSTTCGVPWLDILSFAQLPSPAPAFAEISGVIRESGCLWVIMVAEQDHWCPRVLPMTRLVWQELVGKNTHEGSRGVR